VPHMPVNVAALTGRVTLAPVHIEILLSQLRSIVLSPERSPDSPQPKE
jgi:hypothetical protein